MGAGALCRIWPTGVGKNRQYNLPPTSAQWKFFHADGET